MSWKSGVIIVEGLWENLAPILTVQQRMAAAKHLIEAFGRADCHNLYELPETALFEEFRLHLNEDSEGRVYRVDDPGIPHDNLSADFHQGKASALAILEKAMTEIRKIGVREL